MTDTKAPTVNSGEPKITAEKQKPSKGKKQCVVKSPFLFSDGKDKAVGNKVSLSAVEEEDYRRRGLVY